MAKIICIQNNLKPLILKKNETIYLDFYFHFHSDELGMSVKHKQGKQNE